MTTRAPPSPGARTRRSDRGRNATMLLATVNIAVAAVAIAVAVSGRTGVHRSQGLEYESPRHGAQIPAPGPPSPSKTPRCGRASSASGARCRAPASRTRSTDRWRLRAQTGSRRDLVPCRAGTIDARLRVRRQWPSTAGRTSVDRGGALAACVDRRGRTCTPRSEVTMAIGPRSTVRERCGHAVLAVSRGVLP